jgi:hypothetical protein
MKSKCQLSVLILIFGILIAGCNDGGGGGAPINVNLSVPSVSNLPDFAGEPVANKEEAVALIQDLAEFIQGLEEQSLQLSLMRQFAARGSARSNNSETFSEVFENEELYPGVVANGFIEAEYRETNTSFRASAKARASLDVDVEDEFILNGRMTIDASGDLRIRESGVSVTLKTNFRSALSISDGTTGMKLVMGISVNIKEDLSFEQLENFDEDNIEEIINEFIDSIVFTCEVFDNDNTKLFNITFSDIEDLLDF